MMWWAYIVIVCHMSYIGIKPNILSMLFIIFAKIPNISCNHYAGNILVHRGPQEGPLKNCHNFWYFSWFFLYPSRLTPCYYQWYKIMQCAHVYLYLAHQKFNHLKVSISSWHTVYFILQNSRFKMLIVKIKLDIWKQLT